MTFKQKIKLKLALIGLKFIRSYAKDDPLIKHVEQEFDIAYNTTGYGLDRTNLRNKNFVRDILSTGVVTPCKPFTRHRLSELWDKIKLLAEMKLLSPVTTEDKWDVTHAKPWVNRRCSDIVRLSDGKYYDLSKTPVVPITLPYDTNENVEVGETKIAHDDCFTAMCLWEVIVEDRNGPWSVHLSERGSCEMRDNCISLASACTRDWNVAINSMNSYWWDKPFDFEFVPWWINHCVNWGGTPPGILVEVIPEDMRLEKLTNYTNRNVK
jgi:hypothetical protein